MCMCSSANQIKNKTQFVFKIIIMYYNYYKCIMYYNNIKKIIKNKKKNRKKTPQRQNDTRWKGNF